MNSPRYLPGIGDGVCSLISDVCLRGALCQGVLCCHTGTMLSFFFRTSATTSLAAGFFSRSRPRGRTRPSCRPRRKCGSRAGSVARALGARSRQIWQVIAGKQSAEPELSRSMETPKYLFSMLHLCCCFLTTTAGVEGLAAMVNSRA